MNLAPNSVSTSLWKHGRLVSLLIAVIIISQLYATAIADENSDCWQIDYSTNFAGHLRVTFSDRALAMKLEKFGVTVIANGPQWNSVVYNDVNKRYLEVTSQQFRSSKFVENLLRRQLLKATSVQSEFTHKSRPIEGFQTSQMILKKRNASGEMEETSEVWVTSGLNVPAHFKQFLQIALGVSHEIDGTPLQISVMEKDLVTNAPHLVQALIAYKIAKASNTDAFKPMAGYKAVKSEISLLTADDAN